MFAVAGQNQLVEFVTQRHAMPHFGGVDTQLENLNPLLQVDEERFRCRRIDYQRTAVGGGDQDLRDLFGVGIRRCRDG